MFKIYQIANGRFQITPTNPNTFNTLSHSVSAAILWRSFQTEAEAQAFTNEVDAKLENQS